MQVLDLVLDFVRGSDPGGEALPRLSSEHLRGGKRSGRGFFAEFTVEKRVVEAGARGIGCRAAKVDGIEPGPVTGSQAHGTGFAAGVELTAGQCKGAERLACGTDGVDFAVSRGVVGPSDAVGGFTNNFSVTHNDRREGSTSAGNNILCGERDGAAQELWIW